MEGVLGEGAGAEGQNPHLPLWWDHLQWADGAREKSVLSGAVAAFVRYVISPCFAEPWDGHVSPCQASILMVTARSDVTFLQSNARDESTVCIWQSPVPSCFNPKLRSDVLPLLHSAPRPSENGSEYQKPVVDTPVISRPSHQWGTFPTTQAAGRPRQVCREVPSTANKDQDILSWRSARPNLQRLVQPR